MRTRTGRDLAIGAALILFRRIGITGQVAAAIVDVLIYAVLGHGTLYANETWERFKAGLDGTIYNVTPTDPFIVRFQNNGTRAVEIGKYEIRPGELGPELWALPKDGSPSFFVDAAKTDEIYAIHQHLIRKTDGRTTGT